jgi:hypothetical protein
MMDRIRLRLILGLLAVCSGYICECSFAVLAVSDAVDLNAVNPRSGWTNTASSQAGSTNRIWNQRLDRFHQWLGDELDGHVKLFDAYFADDDREEIPSSSFKLKLYIKVKEGSSSIQVKPSLDSRLALPHVENKLHLFIDNIAPDELPGQDPADRKEQLQIGLRSFLHRQADSVVKLDGGVRWSGKPILFSTLRWRKEIPVDTWLLSFQEKGFWYSDDGFGEQTQMNWERWLLPDLGFRSTTAAQWTETSTGVEMEQSLCLGYVIEPGKRGIACQASVFPNKNSALYINNSLINVTYRMLIYRQWLYFEVTPQVEFPEEHDHEATASIRVGIDMFMGEHWFN